MTAEIGESVRDRKSAAEEAHGKLEGCFPRFSTSCVTIAENTEPCC